MAEQLWGVVTEGAVQTSSTEVAARNLALNLRRFWGVKFTVVHRASEDAPWQIAEKAAGEQGR